MMDSSRTDVLLVCITIAVFGLGWAIQKHLSNIEKMLSRFLDGPHDREPR